METKVLIFAIVYVAVCFLAVWFFRGSCYETEPEDFELVKPVEEHFDENEFHSEGSTYL